MKRVNLIGQTFGRLTVVDKAGYKYKSHVGWRCVCSCGNEVVASSGKLMAGKKRSCGCLEKENQASLNVHGSYGARTYRTWQNMKTRCTNPKSVFFDRYGGRGVKICDRWSAFQGFLEDMGERPPGATIERIDNNGDYEPSNCRWALPSEQANNRSSNIRVVYQGEEMTLKQWAKRLGLKYATVYWRFKRGKPLDEVFSK